MSRYPGILFLLLLSVQSLRSQQNDSLVQLSGLVMSSDSLEALPYVTILIERSFRGTTSNYLGFFSIVAAKGDTLAFSYVGFKKKYYVVPETLDGTRYSVIQLLTRDTINLAETFVYPWPSKEKFKEVFLALNVPDDDLERAKKNLEREKLKELGAELPADANETIDLYMRRETYKYYHFGQTPPMPIFDPLKWKEFIEAWKRGDFKRKK